MAEETPLLALMNTQAGAADYPLYWANLDRELRVFDGDESGSLN